MRNILPLFAGMVFGIFANSSGAANPIQATYYASTNGSGNVGSQDAPCSLTGVRDLIRKINQKMTGDIIINLRGGTYTLTSPFELVESTDIHDSGTNGYNIIYQAYPGETPVISGGLQVTGWELFDHDKNIYRAKVPVGTKSRQFYINDERAVRARGPLHPEGWTKTDKGWTITDTSMQNWRNISDIEIVSRSSWKHLRCAIASISGTNVIMKTPGWFNCSKTPHPGNPFNGGGTQEMRKVEWVENAYELLKEPRSWYLDSKEGYVYYIPADWEDMSTAETVLPVLETILNVHGTNFDNRIQHLAFKGLTFKYGTWMLPSGNDGYADNQTGVLWVNVPPTSCITAGNLSFQYASNIDFEDNVVAHMGGAGIDFGHGPQKNVILGNCLYDISGNGIFLGEVLDYASKEPREWCDENTIKDNYITKVGVEFEDQVGICTGYTRHLLLDHNEIFDLNYSGITVGWGWSKMGYSHKNAITNNFIHKYMQILEDGGGIYTLGNQGTPEEHTVWSGNYITGGKRGQGLYSDEGSGYMDITNNYVTHVGANWMNIWCKWIHDIHVHDNFSDKTNVNNHGTNCIVENNVMNVQPEKDVPAGAQEIVKNAGLEPQYVAIKDKVPVEALKKIQQDVNDNDPAIVYTGAWSAATGRNMGDIDNDIHHTSENGNSASLSFQGLAIDYITECYADEGEVNIYVDGSLVKTVDCRAADRKSQQVVYHQTWNEVGKHEIKIEKKSGQFMILDAFRVYRKLRKWTPKT